MLSGSPLFVLVMVLCCFLRDTLGDAMDAGLEKGGYGYGLYRCAWRLGYGMSDGQRTRMIPFLLIVLGSRKCPWSGNPRASYCPRLLVCKVEVEFSGMMVNPNPLLLPLTPGLRESKQPLSGEFGVRVQSEALPN
jgi:hypothetical protein